MICYCFVLFLGLIHVSASCGGNFSSNVALVAILRQSKYVCKTACRCVSPSNTNVQYMDMYGHLLPVSAQNLVGDVVQQQAGSFQSHTTSELGFATDRCVNN